MLQKAAISDSNFVYWFCSIASGRHALATAVSSGRSQVSRLDAIQYHLGLDIEFRVKITELVWCVCPTPVLVGGVNDLMEKDFLMRLKWE